VQQQRACTEPVAAAGDAASRSDGIGSPIPAGAVAAETGKVEIDIRIGDSELPRSFPSINIPRWPANSPCVPFSVTGTFTGTKDRHLLTG
jgi:hypothetical protein